jgi:hypothetical protein
MGGDIAGASNITFLSWPRSYLVPHLEVYGVELSAELRELISVRFWNVEDPMPGQRIELLTAQPIVLQSANGSVDVQRWGIYFSDIEVVDVVLEIESATLSGELGRMPSAELDKLREDLLRDASGDPVSVSNLLDAAFQDLTGESPHGLLKTRFGIVCSVADSWLPPPAACTTIGLEEDHQVRASHDRLVVQAPGGLDHHEMLPYVFLALFACRARLLHSELMNMVRQLVHSTSREELANSATAEVFETTVRIGRRALLVRPYFTAVDLFAVGPHIALHDRVTTSLVLSEREWQALDTTLEGLERYAQGVYALSSSRSQQALNRNGFLFAAFGLFFTAIGVATLFSGGPFLPVLLSWALCVVCFLAANPEWRRPPSWRRSF